MANSKRLVCDQAPISIHVERNENGPLRRMYSLAVRDATQVLLHGARKLYAGSPRFLRAGREAGHVSKLLVVESWRVTKGSLENVSGVEAD